MQKKTKKTAGKKAARKTKKTKRAAKGKAGGTVSTAASAAKPLKVAPKTFRARIRMYRHGLGDCFLLSFPGKDKQLVHFMIDCGVVLGTTDPGPVMTKVAKDIKKATDGTVDVLAITHEHWDHVSGFDAAQARDVFSKITFKKLWLAWTEDDKNDLANALRDERERKKAAARAAKKKAAELKLTGQVERLTGLLGFFGAAASNSGDGDEEADSGGGTAGALKYIKGRCKPTIVSTGEKPLIIPGVDNVRVYVHLPAPDCRRSSVHNLPPCEGLSW